MSYPWMAYDLLVVLIVLALIASILYDKASPK
jgi:hypothetical protein